MLLPCGITMSLSPRSLAETAPDAVMPVPRFSLVSFEGANASAPAAAVRSNVEAPGGWGAGAWGCGRITSPPYRPPDDRLAGLGPGAASDRGGAGGEGLSGGTPNSPPASALHASVGCPVTPRISCPSLSRTCCRTCPSGQTLTSGDGVSTPAVPPARGPVAGGSVAKLRGFGTGGFAGLSALVSGDPLAVFRNWLTPAAVPATTRPTTTTTKAIFPAKPLDAPPRLLTDTMRVRSASLLLGGSGVRFMVVSLHERRVQRHRRWCRP